MLMIIIPAGYRDGECCDVIHLIRQYCPEGVPDVKCALKKVSCIERWLKENNFFKVLVTGKMGTGKTTFIRGLTENYMPEEDDLLPHTVNVTPHEYVYKQMVFRLYDTPGLQDDINSSNDGTYLRDMVKNSYSPDLIVFAVKMDDGELRLEDNKTMKAVTDAFGWKCWEKAMFILTFANKVSKIGVDPDSKENKIHFNQERDHLTLQIVKALKANKVHSDVVNQIPIVPVGLIRQPLIPSDQSKESWIGKFWKGFNQVLNRKRQEEQPPPVGKEKTSCPTCPPNPTCPTCPPTYPPPGSQGWLDWIWNSIWNVLTTIWNSIWNVFTTIWNSIWNVFTTIWKSIWNVFTTIWNSIWNVFTTIWNSIWNVFTTIWNSDTITTIFNIIWKFTTICNKIVKLYYYVMGLLTRTVG